MNRYHSITRHQPRARSDSWGTPRWLFAMLDEEFHFTLDAASNKALAKCPRYFDRKRDGLRQRWRGRVFCNPPYGKQTYKWVAKAFLESQRGCLVVMVLPAWTDRKWFHEFCIQGELRFTLGRLEFEGVRKNAGVGVPFGVVVVIFRPHCKERHIGQSYHIGLRRRIQ